MDKNVKPKKTMDFRWQTDQNGAILINVRTKKTYQLNPTAFEIWKACNGKRDITEIVKVLKDKYPDIQEEKLVGDVEKTLSNMADTNLLKAE
jgi:hypothetical protein